MGAAASSISFSSLSAEQVGKLVGGLGGKYVVYEPIIADNGLSGDVLMSLDDAGMKDIFKSVNITNPVHQTVLISHFNKLKNPTAAGGASHNHVNNADCCQYHALPSNFEVGEKITKTPRFVMNKLFEIQGISVDPTDLDPAVDKIVKAVGVGFGDGKTKYDCFLNYRVAADADLAEKLYLYLATKGIHAFLDKKCLKNGEKWKDGFLTGEFCLYSFLSLNTNKLI